VGSSPTRSCRTAPRCTAPPDRRKIRPVERNPAERGNGEREL
jgi:hypothetical protein